jgi:hypothetical protein
MNRRRFLSALLLESGLLALSACRPAISLPFYRNDPSRLPPRIRIPAGHYTVGFFLPYIRSMTLRHFQSTLE